MRHPHFQYNGLCSCQGNNSTTEEKEAKEEDKEKEKKRREEGKELRGGGEAKLLSFLYLLPLLLANKSAMTSLMYCMSWTCFNQSWTQVSFRPGTSRDCSNSMMLKEVNK